MTHSNRSRTWLAPLLALALLAPATASASDHLMTINEVMLSHGSAGAQFIELYDPVAETFPSGPYNLVIYDADGVEVGSVLIDPPVGGAPMLVSTAVADSTLGSTRDVVLTVALPEIGQACFTNSAGAIHCVAWGCVTTMVAGAEAIPAAADTLSAQRQADGTWQVATPTADAANNTGTTQAACTAGDACEATDTNAIDTVGCNGGVPGPVADGAHGGNCTPTGTAQGTCTDPTHICTAGEGEVGVCISECTPSALTYVSTGGCPTGSRCFDLMDAAYCYADCNSGADCASGVCDGEGSCLGSGPPPAPDAGPMATPDSGPAPTADAGTGGGADAGTGGGGGGGCSVQPTTGGLAGAPLALFALGLLFWRRRKA